MFPFRSSVCTLFTLLVLASGCTGRRTANRTGMPVAEGADKVAAGESEGSANSAVVADSAGLATSPEPGHSCITFPDGAKLVDSLYYLKDDTTFLYHCTWNHSDGTGHIKAFVVRDRLSEQFRELHKHSTLHTLDAWNAKQLEDQIKMLRELRPGPLPVHAIDGCPRTWIPLATLRGKHYVDLLNVDPVWITDSLYIEQFMDGPMPGRIETFEQLSPAHYRLRTIGPAYPEPGKQVDIHIIDPVRQIAVVVFRTQDVEYGMLYGALERIDQFDLVDWDVTDIPAGDEIPWDDLDCLALVPEEERGRETDTPDSRHRTPPEEGNEYTSTEK